MSLKFSTLSWRSLYCTNNKARIFGICNPLSTPFPLKVSYSSLLSTRRAIPFRANLYARDSSTISVSGEVPLLGVELEGELIGYIFGRKKATDVAHSVWKHVVRKGDIVVDATCGNGYDTLAMVKLVADASGRGGCVYGMDIQKDALSNTFLMLGASLSSDEEQLVKLFPMCHSKMEEVIPKDATVRLVAFNLGYLPGGDKTITTTSETTLLALEAARRIVEPGGLISVVVYVGHPSGREEFETVQKFASGLPTDDWVCSKLQMLNRPLAPVPIFMFRR